MAMMTKVQVKRLLNVARACREADPKLFDMGVFGRPGDGPSCGTPACALGNYCARRDLQRSFTLRESAGTLWPSPDALAGDPFADPAVGYDHWAVLEHFGLEPVEAARLFGASGCGKAGTSRLKAARFIERFVKAKQRAGEAWIARTRSESRAVP